MSHLTFLTVSTQIVCYNASSQTFSSLGNFPTPPLSPAHLAPPLDPGSNNSGHYELQAVLTHQGRSSSSGHYLAWAKTHNRGWLRFDDDIVTPVTEEDVLKLSGGGDWHMAYILLYGPRQLEKMPQ